MNGCVSWLSSLRRNSNLAGTKRVRVLAPLAAAALVAGGLTGLLAGTVGISSSVLAAEPAGMAGPGSRRR